MPADLPLILNLDNQTPAARRVMSATVRALLALPPLIAGMTYAAEVKGIDNTGAYRDDSGASGYLPRLQITYVDANDEVVVLAETVPAGFAQIANGWSFDLSLATAELLAALPDGSAPLLVNFELIVTGPDGFPKTWYRAPASIQSRLYDPANPSPTPGETYPTFAQMLRGNVRNIPAIVGLLGGGASKLDGLATINGAAAAGDKVLVYLPTTKDLLLFEGVAAAPPAESAYAVIADDQPAAFYWQLIAHLGRDGRPVAYNSDQAAYHAITVTGAAGLEQLGVGAAFNIPTA